MTLEAVDDLQPGPVEHLAVEAAPVVDDDADGCAVAEHATRVAEHGRNTVDVRLDRLATRAERGPAQLPVTALVETEQLVRVTVLTVVVDQARVGR